jgi:hypothetical protein
LKGRGGKEVGFSFPENIGKGNTLGRHQLGSPEPRQPMVGKTNQILQKQEFAKYLIKLYFFVFFRKAPDFMGVFSRKDNFF